MKSRGVIGAEPAPGYDTVVPIRHGVRDGRESPRRTPTYCRKRGYCPNREIAYGIFWRLFFTIDRWLVSSVHYGLLDDDNDGLDHSGGKCFAGVAGRKRWLSSSRGLPPTRSASPPAPSTTLDTALDLQVAGWIRPADPRRPAAHPRFGD
jgi:hypothetical protein